MPKPLPPDRRGKSSYFLRQAGSFVPKIAAKAFERYGFHTAEIMTAWDRVAGAEFASFTRPEKLSWPRQGRSAEAAGGQSDGVGEGSRPGATLVLRVDPARALDAEYRRHQIVDQINRYFGYRAVDTIKLIQVPIEHGGGLRAGAEPAKGPPPAPAPMPAALADPELTSALERLWAGISRKRR